MSFLKKLKNEVLNGKRIDKQEALLLIGEPHNELAQAANEIRNKFCGFAFDLCTIVNAKSGKCSENCKFCAQSSFYNTETEQYPLLSENELLAQAEYNQKNGVKRYSIVTSGRNISDEELLKICESVKLIKEKTSISVCVSLGLLNQQQFSLLKEAGVSRVHNNLETSRNYFPNICTSHTYNDKITAINAAKSAGLVVCSGGIIGLGENMEDRIDMAFMLRELEISSVPVNLLNPIEGTPYENNKLIDPIELQKIVSVFRFILPDSFIRLAGGRGFMQDLGREYFLSGANAAITGDMLTTKGISIEKDIKMIRELGYEQVK